VISLKTINDTFHRGQVRRKYRRLLGCIELGKDILESLISYLTEYPGANQRSGAQRQPRFDVHQWDICRRSHLLCSSTHVPRCQNTPETSCPLSTGLHGFCNVHEAKRLTVCILHRVQQGSDAQLGTDALFR
jgi:hypothetical protein